MKVDPVKRDYFANENFLWNKKTDYKNDTFPRMAGRE